MELDWDDIVDKLPSLEQIFGLIWIISWIAAIWAYHIQFFLTGVFSLFIALILLGRFDKKEEQKQVKKPPILFSMDKNTRTLTVQKIYDKNLKWTDNEICSGNAELPKGFIKTGDRLTNCDGNLALRHIPSNTLMGAYNFENNED